MMSTRASLATLALLCALALVVALCGCGGTGGVSGPSVDTAGKPAKPPPPPPPSGEKIAFQRWLTSGKEKNSWQVFTMCTDGSGQTQLTHTSGGLPPIQNAGPSWSGDGRLCFMSSRDGEKRIYVMDGDGSAQHAVTDPPDGCGDDGPDWCLNDPSKIVFSRHRPGTALEWDIWVLNLASGVATQVTTSPTYDDFPSCSPDGRFVVFTRKHPTENRKDLYVVNLASGEVSPLTHDGSPVTGYYPDWSPSGDAIAYYYYAEAWQIPVDPNTGEATGAPTQLTTDYTAASEYFPTWSPLQDLIAYSTEGDRIVTVDLAGGAKTDLAAGRSPDWSPVLP
jgi:Tol biopolymer transport system component